MSDDEIVCYLFTVMPLDQWHKLAQVIRKIMEAGYGSVRVTVKDGAVFAIEYPVVSERMKKE